MYTKAAVIAALASFTAATPVPQTQVQPPQYFGIIATHSTSPVHLQAVNANGRAFYIGKPTQAYCPTGVDNLDCSKYQNSSTIFAASPGSQGVSLDSVAPGGQQVYVGPDGALGFTQAHSTSVPAGSRYVPFTYTPQDGEGRVGNLAFDGQSFYACPVGEGEESVYQIYSAENTLENTEACIGINLATATYDSKPTWQYV